MQHYYLLYFWLPPLVSNDYRWWFSPAILYGGIRQYHVVEEPEEGPWKMIYGSIESVLTKSIDSWTAWRKAFTFHLIFLQVISKLRIVMMWHAVLHHYDLFRHGAPLFNSTEEDPYTLVVEQVPESRVSGTLSTMEEWVEGKFTKVFFIFCQIFPKARARAFTSLRLKLWYAPLWKIIKCCTKIWGKMKKNYDSFRVQ